MPAARPAGAVQVPYPARVVPINGEAVRTASDTSSAATITASLGASNSGATSKSKRSNSRLEVRQERVSAARASINFSSADFSAALKAKAKEDSEDMPLETSMWSVAFFIGIEEIGEVASAYLAFLLVACITMQGSIIYLLGVSRMTKPIFNEASVAAFRAWRHDVAHHISNYDSVAGISLTRKVCDGNDALSVSSAIADDYGVVSQYLSKGKLVGIVMTLVSLISWYMTLGKEINSGAHPALV